MPERRALYIGGPRSQQMCDRVDPTSVEEIAAAMASLLDDPGLRVRLPAPGLRRAVDFSWKRTVQTLLEKMKTIISL